MSIKKKINKKSITNVEAERKNLIVRSLREIGDPIDFYIIESKLVPNPKCKMCNKNREYIITTPDKRKHIIPCKCKSEYRDEYYVSNKSEVVSLNLTCLTNKELEGKIIFIQTSINNDPIKGNIVSVEDDSFYNGEDIEEYLEKAKEGERAKRTFLYGIYKTKEDAQKVADYLNKK